MIYNVSKAVTVQGFRVDLKPVCRDSGTGRSKLLIREL